MAHSGILEAYSLIEMRLQTTQAEAGRKSRQKKATHCVAFSGLNQARAQNYFLPVIFANFWLKRSTRPAVSTILFCSPV